MTKLLPKFLQIKKTSSTHTFKGVIVDIEEEEILSEFDEVRFLRFAYNSNESIVALAAIKVMGSKEGVSLTKLWEQVRKTYSTFPLENFMTILQLSRVVEDETETHHHYKLTSDLFHNVRMSFIEAAQEDANKR
jgi:hypothetical protein